MPAVSAIQASGAVPLSSLENETYLVVQSVTTTGSRDKKTYMDATGATVGLEYRNPTISFAVDAHISAYDGLVNYNPGQEVTSLANFATSRFGFAPGDGTLIFEEPSITESNQEAAKITFTVVQYPFVS